MGVWYLAHGGVILFTGLSIQAFFKTVFWVRCTDLLTWESSEVGCTSYGGRARCSCSPLSLSSNVRSMIDCSEQYLPGATADHAFETWYICDYLYQPPQYLEVLYGCYCVWHPAMCSMSSYIDHAWTLPERRKPKERKVLKYVYVLGTSSTLPERRKPT